MRTAISTILIVAAIAIFYFYADPSYQNTKVLRAQLAQYNQALDNTAKLRAIRTTLIDKYNKLGKDQIDRIQKLLPDGVDNIRLILDINGMASKYGVSLKNIKISTPPANISDQNQNPIGSLQLSFSISTSYENFTQFLSDLESSLRVVDVVGISFSKADPKSNLTTYNLTVQTYWLK